MKGSASKQAGGAWTEDVQAFLDALDHPREPEILALRRIVLAADPAIAEGIEWNAPSFRTSWTPPRATTGDAVDEAGTRSSPRRRAIPR